MSDWRQRRKKQSVATHYDSKFSLHVQLYFNVFFCFWPSSSSSSLLFCNYFIQFCL